MLIDITAAITRQFWCEASIINVNYVELGFLFKLAIRRFGMWNELNENE